MRVPRIYVDTALAVDEDCVLPAEAAHYIHNVLRMKIASPIVLFNGDGNDYSGILSVATKRAATVFVDSKIGLSVESPLPIHLGQGISKGDRMDVALQKATELGVTEITPLITERCNVKITAERWEKKHQQWLKIIIGACEQSGRNTLPILHPPIELNKWLGQTTQAVRLTLDPHAEQTMGQLPITQQHGVRLLIGPEGGFAETETYNAAQLGFQTVTFGPRVLRTETAALASIAVLQAQYGDLL